MTFFDIHTHQKCKDEIVCIRNIIIDNTTTVNIDKNKYYSAGIHPWYLPENNNDALQYLEELLQEKMLLAVGEIGLDFKQKVLQNNSKKKQIEVFLQQIELAEKYQKPIIIHCVKAWDELLKIKAKSRHQLPWIIHGFSKNKRLAAQLLKAGFLLSYGANIFKSKANAEALSSSPLNSILFETDEQSEIDIRKIYQKAARILDLDPNELGNQIKENFEKTF
jgi:TatD DNase family protein